MRALAGAIFTGGLLLAPAARAQTCTPVVGNFTSEATDNIYTVTPATATQQVNAFQVEMKARMQGATYLFDQTYNAAITDPTVQAAITQAEGVLTSARRRLICGSYSTEQRSIHYQQHQHQQHDHCDECDRQRNHICRAPERERRSQPEHVRLC
jgi:hypothetical protein